ncbi:flagellar hook capping FlgD N-terminal domain-containing protein [Moorella sp. Hama-1]|uniref:flagellar hook capping FlgD N-terminal domain-containing protein n=1 Tax=Moorella sp. Hama-1 TaxID=2138101 RepID=UPI000D65C9EC|nr:flagellar hook capping FlgD N-terminal domain-containing protein [Moorella sp. Hama-1]BCV20814.1 flagellar hook capping protein [Moorella sp. Hama-1]
MNVGGVTAAASQAATGTTTTVPNKGLGKDDFLKLLAAQLENQDPLSPMSNTDFIAQMAQFSALEQMNNLNDSFNRVQQELQAALALQAVSLIGKEVTATVNEQTLQGTVEKVNLAGDGAVLTVNGQQVPLSAVTEVGPAAPTSPATPTGPGAAPTQP